MSTENSFGTLRIPLLGPIAGSFCPDAALALRPFVTDDARIVYKGQVVTETYGGVTMVNGDKQRQSSALGW